VYNTDVVYVSNAVLRSFGEAMFQFHTVIRHMWDQSPACVTFVINKTVDDLG
jgi:hypothetical protein